MRAHGFTLAEVLIAVVIVGILGSLTIIPMRKTIERSRWRQARSTLQAIYAGEQTYFLANDETKYFNPKNPGACTAEGEPAAPCWQVIYMDDPNGGEVVYKVAPAGKTFAATATRSGGDACTNWTFSINEQKMFGGANSAESSVCP